MAEQQRTVALIGPGRAGTTIALGLMELEMDSRMSMINAYMEKRTAAERQLKVAQAKLELVRGDITKTLRDSQTKYSGESVNLRGKMKEEMSTGPAKAPYRVAWTTLGGYLDSLQHKGISPNVASYVGASTVRAYYLGFEDRTPSPPELDSMCSLVRQGMREGALGVSTGKSLVEADKVDLAKELLAKYGDKLMLPVDHIVAAEFAENAPNEAVDEIPDGMMGMDIGPKTAAAFGAVLRGAKTIIWNGPMGVFEKKPFDKGTIAVGLAVAESGALSVVGGGDSEKAVKSAGVADKISHISTGGGASLEYLSGLVLPGVAALTDK